MRTLIATILVLFFSSCRFTEDPFLESYPDFPENVIGIDTSYLQQSDTLISPSDTVPPYSTDTLEVDSIDLILDTVSTSTTDDETKEIPDGFVEVYSTSFEEVKEKKRHYLNWEFPHWVEYAAMHTEDGGRGNGIGGGQIWVDHEKAHTGSQSIGLALNDISKSRRTELTIFPEDYLKNEYYISYWVYLPERWGLFAPDIDWDWFEIGNPFISNGTPYSAIHIIQASNDQSNFKVALDVRDEQGEMHTYSEKRIKLTKGAWFNIRYYVRRSLDNGAIKLWFDEQFIGEVSGIPTMSSKDPGFNVSIAKIYHERGDTTAHSMWIDDLKLFTKN